MRTDEVREPRLPDPQFKSAPLPSRAAAAGRKMQFVIREDGVVFEKTKHLIKRNDFRIYTGKMPCNVEEGREWLYGEGGEMPVDTETDTAFDVETATKGQLIIHAHQKYKKTINRAMNVQAVRDEVKALIEAYA